MSKIATAELVLGIPIYSPIFLISTDTYSWYIQKISIYSRDIQSQIFPQLKYSHSGIDSR